MQYFLSIFIGTFILEDAALALAIGLVAAEKILLTPAFLACFLGICLGDIGLYYLGFFIRKLKLEDRFKAIKKFRLALINNRHSNIMAYSVVVCRFIPGTRLPTYLIAGFLRFSIWRFIFLTIISVLVWVSLAFAVGHSLKALLMDHLWLSLILTLLILRLFKFLVPKLSDPWQRKSLLHSWRKLSNFEFWPASFFYLPIIPYYVFLSIKHLSLLAPFYANPGIKNGGLIGESKWDFLKYLKSDLSHHLKCLKISKNKNLDEVQFLLKTEEISYPFILKPDVGQRGFAVQLIESEQDLKNYLAFVDSDIIAQELSHYPNEAGIFYVKYPFEQEGFIFSITDKKFPTIIGDGKTQLGDLILKDPRARIISSTYFSKLQKKLNKVPAEGELVLLSEYGNHSQGAIFFNGESFKSEELTKAIDQVTKQIPNFYFGRLDIRYKNSESLVQGKDFEIVEINGAGSEATHIWDAKTTLLEAYRTLFIQWKILFEIGSTISHSKALSTKKVHVFSFFKECFKVFFRKERKFI